MPIIVTDLSQTYYKDSCIDVVFGFTDVGGVAHYAFVVFNFDSNFVNIADGTDFVFLNETYTTGVGDGLVDLSSSDVETNIAAFSEFFYSRFNLNGMYLPPESYGDNLYTYDSSNDTGEMKIIWTEGGLVDPFEFDITTLSGVTSPAIYEGAEHDGKKNYRVLYQIFTGVKSITPVFSLPSIAITTNESPAIDLALVLRELIHTMDIRPIIDTWVSVLDDELYREFYIRYGSRWTPDDSCLVEYSDFSKSEKIKVLGRLSNVAGFLTRFKHTSLCKGTRFLLWASGEFTNYKIKYAFDTGIGIEEHNLNASENQIYAIPFGWNIVNKYASYNNYDTDSLVGAQITLRDDDDNVIDTHTITIGGCECCTEFYYEMYDGGWNFVCLRPTDESLNIVRTETCIFGCNEDTRSHVRSIDRSVKYQVPNAIAIELAKSPKVYYKKGYTLHEVRVEQGNFTDKTNEIIISG